jgi:hypothetical protein
MLMQRVLFLGTVLLVQPALAQQPSPDRRATLLQQTMSAQIQALDGANQLCQMDVAELRQQLAAAQEELRKLKVSASSKEESR